VSLAAAKAAPGAKGVPRGVPFGDLPGNLGPVVLPAPCFNAVNDGSRAGNELAFQGYCLHPRRG